jgi:hypothetical protein
MPGKVQAIGLRHGLPHLVSDIPRFSNFFFLLFLTRKKLYNGNLYLQYGPRSSQHGRKSPEVHLQFGQQANPTRPKS